MKNHSIEKDLLMLFVFILFIGFSYFARIDTLSGITGRTVNIGGSCSVADNAVFLMSDIDNAHAAVANDTNVDPLIYDINVCLQNPSSTSRDCIDVDEDGFFDNSIIRLSDIDNAHVEQNDLSTPGYFDVCYDGLICEYQPDCSTAGPEYECFGSISSNTNAHIGDCSAYSTKICCNSGCSITRAYWTLDASGLPVTDDVVEGTIVRLNVDGTPGCTETDLINITLYEDEGTFREDVLEKEFLNIPFTASRKLAVTWSARWFDDGLPDPDPEYYFKANTTLTTPERSEITHYDSVFLAKDLEVTEDTGSPGGPGSCGDGTLDITEVCDDNGTPADHTDDSLPGGKEFCDQHGPWQTDGDGDSQRDRVYCDTTCNLIKTDDCYCDDLADCTQDDGL